MSAGARSRQPATSTPIGRPGPFWAAWPGNEYKQTAGILKEFDTLGSSASISSGKQTRSRQLSLRAYLSQRVVTPGKTSPAAILVENEQIRAVVAPDQVPARAELHDFGDAAILPGLVDSHVHINDPGRAEWEGFETATRAAAAGGYTLLVDMPLNCLPATTNVTALQAKRAAAQGKCSVDWAAWGGVVHNNQTDIEALAAAGAR